MIFHVSMFTDPSQHKTGVTDNNGKGAKVKTNQTPGNLFTPSV